MLLLHAHALSPPNLAAPPEQHAPVVVGGSEALAIAALMYPPASPLTNASTSESAGPLSSTGDALSSGSMPGAEAPPTSADQLTVSPLRDLTVAFASAAASSTLATAAASETAAAGGMAANSNALPDASNLTHQGQGVLQPPATTHPSTLTISPPPPMLAEANASSGEDASPVASTVLPPLTPTQCHARAVAVLREEPEGDALRRCEESLAADQAMYDPLRMEPELEGVAMLLPLRSALDKPLSVPERPPLRVRWEAKVRAAGVDPNWRPAGGERGLLQEGNEDAIDEVRRWFAKEAMNDARRVDGLAPLPHPDLHQRSAEVLRHEALVMAPWWLLGPDPVPAATLDPETYRRLDALAPSYFARRLAAGDRDADICSQAAGAGIELDTKVIDTLLAADLKSAWEQPEYSEKTFATIEKEIEQGSFSQHTALPCYPTRRPPRFIVDEGYRPDGSRKLRAIVHHSYPYPVEGRLIKGGSTNYWVDLSEHPQLRLGSGRAAAKGVGICKTSGANVLKSKADGANAFRQVDTAPIDWWHSTGQLIDRQQWLLKRELRWHYTLDRAIAMGGKSAMIGFQRVVEVGARDVAERANAFDADHPPSMPSVQRFVQERTRKLGPVQGARLSDDDQYCDDSIRADIDDPIAAAYTTAITTKGETTSRGKEKMAIFYSVFEKEMNMVMAPEGSDKHVSTYGDLEELGVEVTDDCQRYPRRKVEPLARRSEDILEEAARVGTVTRGEVHQLVSKQKWAAHVALEMNPLLASGFALANAPGGAGARLPISQRFAADQRATNTILRSHPSLPLVPRSTFPPAHDLSSVTIFQDASTSFGAAGWALVCGTMHSIRLEWPMWVKVLIHEGVWSISPGEAWILHVMLEIVLRGWSGGKLFITTFSDNESAKAAANRLSAVPVAMSAIADALGSSVRGAKAHMRAMRVTTHENATADADSREGSGGAAAALAERMGVPHVLHTLLADDPLWKLIVPNPAP